MKIKQFILSVSLVASSLVLFGSSANAVPMTTMGTPVSGFGSTTPVGTPDASGFLEFYIPLSPAQSGTFGVGGIGTSSDVGSGPGFLDLFLNFGILSGVITDVELVLDFIDLDLSPVNDPTGFFESVALFGPSSGSSGEIDSLLDGVPNFYSVTGNFDTQAITFVDLAPIATIGGPNPPVLGLHFTVNDFVGTMYNTPEYVRATLTYDTEVPEPSSVLLLLLGVAGIMTFKRWHR